MFVKSKQLLIVVDIGRLGKPTLYTRHQKRTENAAVNLSSKRVLFIPLPCRHKELMALMEVSSPINFQLHLRTPHFGLGGAYEGVRLTN